MDTEERVPASTIRKFFGEKYQRPRFIADLHQILVEIKKTTTFTMQKYETKSPHKPKKIIFMIGPLFLNRKHESNLDM